jgi:hypothetical protein
MGRMVMDLMRIGWAAFFVSANLCVQTGSMPSPVHVLPLPIRRQTSSSTIVGLRRRCMLPASHSRRAALRPSIPSDQRFFIVSSLALSNRRTWLVEFGDSEAQAIPRNLTSARIFGLRSHPAPKCVKWPSTKLHRRTCAKDQLTRERAVL